MTIELNSLRLKLFAMMGLPVPRLLDNAAGTLAATAQGLGRRAAHPDELMASFNLRSVA